MDVGILNSLMQTGFLGMAVLVGVYFMMRYLQRGKSESSSEEYEELKKQIANIRNRVSHPGPEYEKYIQELKYQIDKIRSDQIGISEDQKKNLVESLTESVKNEAATEILDEIKKKVEKSEEERYRLELVEAQHEATIGRLKEELFSLSKRGNLNLSIGIMITISGLALLGMFVINFDSKSSDISTFIIDFFPRISLVLLIEIFAYFFLSLYKASLSEIKYFQNEVTSIESRLLALRVALDSEDPNNVSKVIDKLSSSERNFILDKGQSTVELERDKVESQSTSDILGKMASIFGNKP